ncbi:MAG TPA: hypothetical protein VH915_06420 [Pedococcus sp.]
MTVDTPTPSRRTEARSPLRRAYWSLAMLPVFVGWTLAFILLSALVAQWLGQATAGGEVPYIESWLLWLAVTLAWVAPLVVGVVLGAKAVRRGAGRAGWVALATNAGVLLLMTGPPLLDRLLHL